VAWNDDFVGLELRLPYGEHHLEVLTKDGQAVIEQCFELFGYRAYYVVLVDEGANGQQVRLTIEGSERPPRSYDCRRKTGGNTDNGMCY